MDGPPPPEEDFSQLPISDRLNHKNWKARVSAYDSLIKTFQNTASDSDPAFKPYISSPNTLKAAVTDANAVAQEKGVEMVATFVKYAGENTARTRDVVVPALVDKCFGSTRAGTKAQSLELVLLYVEVENSAAGVVTDVLPGLAAKQPKVVSGTVAVLKEIVKNFGAQVVPPQPILKALPKIFAHSDKTVRAEGTALVQSLYQCIGAAIEPFLGELKPVQVKELNESFEKMDAEGKGKGTFKASRYTRATARDMEAGGDAPEDEVLEEAALPDPRSFAEEVDIVPKLPKNLQAALSSSKWKERKEVLDELAAVVNTPRIKDAPEIGDVVKGLAGRMGDTNINCVIGAAQCLELLAKGLMGSFGRFREIVVPPMLERLKERKQTVTDALGVALDAVFTTTSLPDILSEVTPPLTSKNPQVKEGTLRFLSRCLTTTVTPPAQAQVKPLSETLAALLEDSYEGARNEAAICLGTLMKIVGERPLNAIMDQLADVRKVKVKEAHDKATVKCKIGSGPPKSNPPVTGKVGAKKPTNKQAEALLDDVAPPKAKPSGRLGAKNASAADDPAEPAKSSAKPPARPAAKKAPAAAASAGSKTAKAAPPAAPSALDSFKYKHTPEDSESLAAELIPTQITADFGDANWKVRLAALEEMTTWVEGVIDDVDCELVVRFLMKKGLNEKNFQVSSKLYGILSILAEQGPSFGRSCIALSTPHLFEKLGDMKLKKPAGDTLGIFAEKSSLQFVLSQGYDTLSKLKAPKMLADSLTWIDATINEFGIAGLSLRTLIEFLKTALGNSNAAVRTSATKTLVTLKIFIGPSVKDLLGELNPQLLTTIQSEFDKADGTSAPEPSRTSQDLQNLVANSAGGAGSATNVDAMNDLFPRVELDALLKGTTILADAKSDAWKTKKEALETLQAILDQGANKRLKPAIGEIGQVLKARVTETNKAVQLVALDVVGKIATGMGKPFEKQTRFFALPVATVLADQKAYIRTTALQTLTTIAEACEGLDSLVPGLATALESQNPTQRSCLLNWIADWLRSHPPSPSLDLNGWASPIVSCLDDRSGDVRKGAQAVLPFLVANCGFDYMMQQTNSLKPAARASVIPLLKAAAANAPTPATVPKAIKAPPPAVAATSIKSVEAPEPSPSAESVTETGSDAAVVPSRAGVVRRKLPLGTLSRPDSRASVNEEAPAARAVKSAIGVKKSGSTAASGVPRAAATGVPTGPSSLSPFLSSSLEAKKSRLARDGIRWIVESGPIRKDVVEGLQNQVEPCVTKELFSLLFSHDHNAVNDFVSGLGVLCDFYLSLSAGEDKFGSSAEERQQLGIANSDLALKYVSIRVHEPQPNLISKCLDVVDNVIAFLRDANHQLSDQETLCFAPTIVHKLGDAREAVRIRVQQIIQMLPKVYPYSRVFQLLLEHGLKSKVAKTRQGTLDEMAGLLKRTGTSACDPAKSFKVIASMISDKDAQVRKSALTALSEGYVLTGESFWSLVGVLSPKDKTQLEERLRRVTLPANSVAADQIPQQPASAGPVSKLAATVGRAASPSTMSRIGGIPRPASPAISSPRSLASPSRSGMASPVPIQAQEIRAPSPALVSKLPSKAASAGTTSPHLTATRPKSMLPSRLGPPRSLHSIQSQNAHPATIHEHTADRPALRPLNGDHGHIHAPQEVEEPQQDAADGTITLTISKILSSDASRSVDALKEVQRILELGPDEGPSSTRYRELSDHTEGLIETITLQMNHVFENVHALAEPDNFRLAKHLIQTVNAFCDHPLLSESLQVDILTALFEELTLRLLQTDESSSSKVKDLSRFINMIILRLFATSRRMTVLRSLFNLLLLIVKPFPANGTPPDAREAKVAELVLKCIWKLARNIPTDLEKQELDAVELFPAIEHFLQSIPPNEWRARATNKVPSGDMPLRTIKVIIQHVVAFYGDDVYDLLSSSFDDPSATIVYPYVYRILNSSRPSAPEDPHPATNGTRSSRSHRNQHVMPDIPPSSRTSSSPTRSSTTSVRKRSSSPSRHTSRSASSMQGGSMLPPPMDEPDPDEQLISIINHISSETTGAMHKEGITELHHFLKAYPHKKPRVDRLLESTGPAFRKYIARALASRAAEDEERNVAVADTLSKLESNSREPVAGSGTMLDPSSPKSPKRSSHSHSQEVTPAEQEKLNRLHDLFQYRSSTLSNGSARSVPSTLMKEVEGG